MIRAMKCWLRSTPTWVVVLLAIAVVGAVTFIVLHLAGGGMHGMH